MSTWLASLPRSHPDLLRVIYDFNHRPGFWIHAEHYAKFSDAERFCLAQLPLSHHPRLNTWLKRQFQLDAAGDSWNFEFPALRIALLPYQDLRALAYHFGAAHVSARLTAMIGKRQIADFKAKFGESAFHFGVRKAHHWPLDPGLMETLPTLQKSISDEIEIAGWGSIQRTLAKLEKPALARLRLKLSPEDLRHFDASIALSFAQDPWPFLQKLIPEILAPSQQSCFA